MEPFMTVLVVVLAVLFGLWLVFSGFGLFLNILGYVLIAAAVIWLVRALFARSGGL